jgi:bifunctional UDP-N-acetylglucosamine pyrophosphorylase/glucosamine-1-phosphate N-acetyltransferase
LSAGAAQVVVVDSPERALEPVLPEGVMLAEQPRPDGTGGAARAGLALLDQEGGAGAEEPTLILSGDVPLIAAEAIAELLEAHRDGGFQATIATTVLADPSGYGRVVRDAEGAVQKVVETKRPGDSTQAEREIREVNTGVFVFAAGALAQVLPRLGTDNAQGELYLPQALELLRADGGTVGAHAMDDPGLVLGVNDLAGLARVREIAQRGILERHMDAGVSVVDPRATVVDVDVDIGADTVIEPFTTIRGATRVGRGCTIRHSYIVDSVLEDGVNVGPFAYLRPGSVLRSGSKVGTFVEVKNSQLGPGAKVPHLSYIGDAEVGEGTNLGAATITANYDGHAKHRTKVGDRVRTGVDTTLVAPVTVGDDAYTGAGSVITEDVPPGALGIARARQENREGYAERGPRTREEDPDEYAERPPRTR